jgi:hypothetical protein
VRTKQGVICRSVLYFAVIKVFELSVLGCSELAIFRHRIGGMDPAPLFELVDI